MKDAVQGGKAPSRASEQAVLGAIAQDVIEQMQDERIYIIGPGTTTRPILQRLGLEKSLIGVDVVYRRGLLALDANEAQLLQLLDKYPGTIVVTPIGGQGYVFGRGNQQLSPAVLRQVGKANILVAATLDKLLALQEPPAAGGYRRRSAGSRIEWFYQGDHRLPGSAGVPGTGVKFAA